MKRLSMFGMAALLLLAMSCKKNEEKPNGGDVYFHASMETPSGNGKTHLDSDGKKVLWDANDAIRVVTGSNKHLDLTVVKIYPEDGSKADFVSNEHGTPENFYTPDYRAYYPSSLYDLATGKITLPAEQIYKPDSFYPGYNPMAAQSHDENLHFQNICGVLVLQLKGKGTVNNITVTSKGDEPLWGTAAVTMNGFDEDMVPTLGTLANGGNTVTLKCYNEPLDLTTPKMFYIVLPPVTFSQGFEVVVTAGDGKVFNQSSAAGIQIKPNYIKKMAVLDVKEYPKGAIPGLFSVAADRKVWFSQGNLQFNTASKKWRFAEHQWEVCDKTTGEHNASEYYAENSGYWIDLFGWGCTGNNPNPNPENPVDPYYLYYQPWSTNYSASNISQYNLHGYGPSTNRLPDTEQDLQVSNGSDWGANVITNGCEGWRTLSAKNLVGEWNYVLSHRTNCQNLRGLGKIGIKNQLGVVVEEEVNGLILLPDDWPVNSSSNPLVPEGCPDFVTYGSSHSYKQYTDNQYSYEQWNLMEANGALFLPAAGYRFRKTGHPGYFHIENVNSFGRYWSSWHYNAGSSSSDHANKAYYFRFQEKDIEQQAGYNRPYGFSVRLVKDYVEEP